MCCQFKSKKIDRSAGEAMTSFPVIILSFYFAVNLYAKIVTKLRKQQREFSFLKTFFLPIHNIYAILNIDWVLSFVQMSLKTASLKFN